MSTWHQALETPDHQILVSIGTNVATRASQRRCVSTVEAELGPSERLQAGSHKECRSNPAAGNQQLQVRLQPTRRPSGPQSSWSEMETPSGHLQSRSRRGVLPFPWSASADSQPELEPAVVSAEPEPEPVALTWMETGLLGLG